MHQSWQPAARALLNSLLDTNSSTELYYQLAFVHSNELEEKTNHEFTTETELTTENQIAHELARSIVESDLAGLCSCARAMKTICYEYL